VTGPFTTLDYTEKDGVAWVMLNRPEVHNAFDLQMIDEIYRCWRMLRANDDVRVIVLTGAGEKAFSSGLDRTVTVIGDPDVVEGLGQADRLGLHRDDPADRLPPKTAGDLWKPVIAAVNGMALGGAFYLLGEVEFIIAAEHATFFDPHTTYGMASVFEAILMAQRMPFGEVMRMSLMGAQERITARRAYEIGLVQEVVPGAELREAAERVATTLAALPPLAVQTTVRAVWSTRELGHRQALDAARTLVQLGTDYSELAVGEAAWASGARPRWRAR
jgi:enoyl-CoA hydratase/carnithine racemase